MAGDLELQNKMNGPLSWPQAGAERFDQPSTTSAAELRSLIAMLQRRRWSIVFGIVAVFAAVATITYYWPKTYESSAVLLVEDPGSGSDSPALAVLERMGRSNQIDTEIELLRSRHVLEQAVDELDLHVSVRSSLGERRPRAIFSAFAASPSARPGEYVVSIESDKTFVIRDAVKDTLILRSDSPDIAFAGLTVTLPTPFPVGGLTIQTSQFDRAVEAARDRVAASQLRREADLVGVSCTGRSPETAQELCETALRNYVILRTNLQRREAATTAAFLREQVERLGDRLESAEDDLESYKSSNRIVALNERASAEVRQFTELRARRDAMEAERSALSRLIQSVQSGQGSSRRYRDLASFPTFLMNDAVTQILASLVELENRRSELAVRRSDRNADLAALDTRIADIEMQLRSLAMSYERSLGEQVRSFDSTLARTNRGLAIIPTQQVESARLERRTGLIEELYRLLETRLREAEVAEAVDLPSVRIVDVASRPFQPSSPNVAMNLALGLFLGLAYGLALALYREYKDPIHERDEVARETGLPVLGMIPRLKEPGPLLPISVPHAGVDNQKRGRHRLPAKRDHQTNGLAVEMLRGLAAELTFFGSSSENGDVSSVAITGATRGEGKTFTACNLALVRASHGARTLLIDADMRANSVTKFFDLPAGPGLSDVLAGSADLTSVWQQVKVSGSELWIIPAGTPTPQSVGLLESPAFTTLLARAARYFDLVIIDTPPVSMTTDAATIATRANAVILVIRGGITDRPALNMTMERLRRARSKIVGVVLNDIPLPSGYVSQYTYAEHGAE